MPQVCGVMLENVFLSVFLNKSRFFCGVFQVDHHNRLCKSRQCIVGCLGQLVVASFGPFVGFCRAGVVWWGFVGGVLCENCRVDASIIPAMRVVWWGGVFFFL